MVYILLSLTCSDLFIYLTLLTHRHKVNTQCLQQLKQLVIIYLHVLQTEKQPLNILERSMNMCGSFGRNKTQKGKGITWYALHRILMNICVHHLFLLHMTFIILICHRNNTKTIYSFPFNFHFRNNCLYTIQCMMSFQAYAHVLSTKALVVNKFRVMS